MMCLGMTRRHPLCHLEDGCWEVLLVLQDGNGVELDVGVHVHDLHGQSRSWDCVGLERPNTKWLSFPVLFVVNVWSGRYDVPGDACESVVGSEGCLLVEVTWSEVLSGNDE